MPRSTPALKVSCLWSIQHLRCCVPLAFVLNWLLSQYSVCYPEYFSRRKYNKTSSYIVPLPAAHCESKRARLSRLRRGRRELPGQRNIFYLKWASEKSLRRNYLLIELDEAGDVPSFWGFLPEEVAELKPFKVLIIFAASCLMA